MATEVRGERQNGPDPDGEIRLINCRQAVIWARVGVRNAGVDLSLAKREYRSAIEDCRQARVEMARAAYERAAPALAQEWDEAGGPGRKGKSDMDGDTLTQEVWDAAVQTYVAPWSDAWEGQDA